MTAGAADDTEVAGRQGGHRSQGAACLKRATAREAATKTGPEAPEERAGQSGMQADGAQAPARRNLVSLCRARFFAFRPSGSEDA